MVNKYARVTGGADQNCLAVMEELKKRGVEVAILSTSDRANLTDSGSFIKAGVTHQTRGQLRIGEQARVAADAFWNQAAAHAMRELIARFHPDVVHAHKLYPQLSIAPVVVAARAGLPVVQTLHDYELLSASALDESGGWVDRDEEQPSYRVLNTLTFPLRRGPYLRRVGAVITCSRFVAERYRAGLGIEPTVLPYFVKIPGHAPREYGEREGAIFVGRLHREKGVDDVIAVAERLPGLRVTIVGYGPLEPRVAEAAERLPNLAFAGRHDRSTISCMLERARVCLMPSRWQEPGGIAALEAMSVGTPVVAYATGGLAEYVTETGGGRAIEPSVTGLAREVQALYNSQQLWRDCSIQGRIGVGRLHSADRYMAGLEEVYTSVLKRR